MAIEQKQILHRAYLVAGFLFLFAVAIIYKLVEIQFVEGDKYVELAEQNTIKNFEIAANRGNVYTADGSLLATSVSKFDIRMDPVSVKDADFESGIKDLSKELSKMLGKSPSYFENYIRKGRANKNRYLFITRNLSYNEYQRIKKFPIFKLGPYKGGLITEQRTVREHPIGKIAERAVGYDDYRGRVGIEGSFYEFLRGKNGKRLKQKIAKGQWKPISDNNEIDPVDGRDIITTIDLNIQDIAHHALLEQLEKFEADHGTVVVMETKTGEVKAISNLGRTTQGTYYEDRNYAVYESHEPGSTFKLMGMVVALEDKVIDTGYMVDTEKGEITFYKRKVKDSNHKGYGVISASRVFEVSSNVGIVKIVDKFYKDQPEKFVQGLKDLNVGLKIGLPIKGEGNPIIPHPNDAGWNGLSLPWMAYGYGVSLTPLQTLTFYNAIANNGEMVKPKFVREIRSQNNAVNSFDKEVINPKICSQETIDKVKVMMENVVKRGTAENIYDPNFSMAGKTGTCQTDYWKEGGPKYISSFVGYFPADNPQYSCIVVIHKPNKKIGYYGNIVAGPVFKKIAHKIYAETPIQSELTLQDSNEVINKSFENYYNTVNKSIKTVPNVTKMAGMDAVPMLENLGFKVRVVGTGVVQSQSVKPGEKLEKGKVIQLKLS
ncbi:penicillin-binding protein [Namhaeicola litoreus]|uniref:Penicillin-binding protein n=1 Tax=Namhaeicola litoreus TaxID=1052145 RepID=A0ABW3Y1P0_9FLAO